MTESLMWWIVQFSLSFMDFVIMYFISHAMMKRYMSVEWKHIALGLIYTMTVAPIFYFDHNLARIVSVLMLLVITKIMIMRTKLRDLIMIYVMSILITVVVQAPIAGGVWLFRQVLEMNESIVMLIAQIIATIVVMIMCRQLKWFKWFDVVQSNHVLKLMLFMIALVILIPIAIINYEHSLSYFLLLTLGFVLAGGVLIPIFNKLYKDSVGIVLPVEVKHRFSDLWFDLRDEQDAEVIKNNLKTVVREYGFELPKFPDPTMIQARRDNTTALTAKVNEFISQKVQQNKEVKVELDIDYFSDYDETINFQQVLDWVNVLLDHALEATTDKTVYLALSVMNGQLSLMIKHEFQGYNNGEIDFIFEKDYAIQGVNHGRGLHQLYETVNQKGGVVTAETYHLLRNHGSGDYLEVTIQIEKEDSWIG